MNGVAEKASRFTGIGVSPMIAPGVERGHAKAGRRGHIGRDFVLAPQIPVGYGYLFVIGYCRRLTCRGRIGTDCTAAILSAYVKEASHG
jgi:hypothetical protein